MSFRTILMITLILFTGSAAMAGVTLTDLGSQVKLDNGIVSATWIKATAEMTSLKHDGDELLGNGGKGYIQQYFDDSYSTPSGATYALETDDPGFKDISFTWIVSGMEMELHYAMGQNDSGIYSYVIADYNSTRAGYTEMQQFNLCLRSDPEIFTRAYVEDDRVFDMPAPEEVAAGTTLVPKEATLLADGTIHYKYLYSNYIKDLDVHGWTGNGKGLWIVSANNEYVNGGPTHQELTVEQSKTTPVTLKHFSASHYGAGSTHFDSDDSPWQKLYGPYMIYLNADAEDADAMWTDAKSKAAQEMAAWPYSWMNNPLYPLAAGRGTITGTLNITDGSSPAEALVILAQPTDGTADTNWQRQGKDYIFWTEAAADGSFTIEEVRSGIYTLYSNVSGVLDEYKLNGINVKAGAVNALGQLNWTPRKHGQLIWQIGTPDRTAAEYRHGDDFRHFGLWFKYPKDFPDGVTYTIGRSNEATDWNYNQWCVRKGSGGYDLSPWTIKFDMAEIVGDQAVLTIAIAAARQARLKVLVNDVEVLGDDALVNDSTGPRAGIQGFYRERIIKFDSSILSTKSTNKIVVTQRRAGLFPSIMYDCIRLETGFKADKKNGFAKDSKAMVAADTPSKTDYCERSEDGRCER